MISTKMWYSLFATFSLSLAIFFKKIGLLMGVPTFRLFLQFMIIAAFTLNINLFIFKRKYVIDIKKIKPSEWKMIFLAGSFLFAAHLVSTFGLGFTTSINYSFINRSTLIFSTILSFLFLGEKMDRDMTVLIIAFFVGVYLVSTAGQLIIPRFGDLLILVGSLFFASFSITQKLINKKVSPELISWGVLSSSAVYSILASLLLKINILSLDSFLFILLAGFFEAIVIVFMNKTIQITSVTYYYMMTMLTPIINGFLGIIFLNESFQAVQIIGGIIIVISVILAQRLKF